MKNKHYKIDSDDRTFLSNDFDCSVTTAKIIIKTDEVKEVSIEEVEDRKTIFTHKVEKP